MSFQFSQKVESLSYKAQKFDVETAASISKLRGRGASVAEAEGIHQQLFEIFQSAMNDISELKKDIHSKTTVYNQEEMFGVVTRVTNFETHLLEELNTFNDTVLTYCPTAKIFYGRPCIGAKNAPKIDTVNPKILEMLASSSSIREIRGDGNCFLSAFTTRFLENLIEKKEIEGFINFITEDGIEHLNLKEEMISTLLYLQEYPSQLENILEDNHKILPFINYFRQLAAAEMKKHKSDFEVFFLADIEQVYHVAIENKSYESLIDQYVLKMGVDFSHPMINALCRKLDFPIRIIDPKIGAPQGVNVLDRGYAEGTFCRNDNHYFVLYMPEESISIPIIPLAQPQINIPSPKPTEIIIKCTVPFGHNLFIRGSGNGLSWEKGSPLIQLDEETWIYPSNGPLQEMEYKFLIDDSIWQNENNFKISNGKFDETTPHFNILPSMSTDILNPPDRTTRITVKFHTELGNKLFIRGNGPGLSWEKGVELRNIGNDLWVYETQANNFENFEYKILLNDQKWEDYHNHKTDCGKKEEVVPNFN
jgi:hypothetical protein